jgi:hypothetical protein
LNGNGAFKPVMLMKISIYSVLRRRGSTEWIPTFVGMTA